MLVPRFSIRTILIATVGFALLFLVAGTAYRGQTWGWAIVIGTASLVLTAFVHAGLFAVAWLFGKLTTAADSRIEPEAQHGIK
jgi:hypothetical protein